MNIRSDAPDKSATDPGEATQEDSLLPGFFTRLSPTALVLLITLVGMSLYEVLAHIVSSKSESLQGHLGNILFTTLIAALSAYIALYRYQKLRYKSKKEKHLRQQLEAYIEEGKQAKATIEMLSLAVEQSPNAVIITDHDRIIEYVNSSFTKNTGYNAGDVIGKTPSVIKFRGTPLSVYKDLLRTIKAGETWRGELNTRKKDGSICWKLLSVTPIKNKQGETIRFLGIQTDITRRHKAEEKLKESEARVRAIVDAATDGIITTDDKGAIQTFNPSAEKIFGHSAQEISGKNVTTLMPQPYQQNHGRYMRAYIETGLKKIIGMGREVTGQRKNGSLFPMELAISEFFVDGQRSFVGIARDISDRREAERQVQEHQIALAHMDRICTVGEMATGLAHEVNQPLTAIYAYAQACQRMLASGRQDSEKFSKAIEQTARRAEQAAAIIRHFRNFTQKNKTNKRPINLNKLIQESMTYLPPAGRKITPIALDLAEEPSVVFADSVQIEQVIINLVRNSMDAIKGRNSGKITLASKSINPNTVEVRITDTGSGISERDTEKIFEAFFTTKQEGNGMGLVISRSIIEDHDGRLWLEKSSAAGTTFAFTLPLHDDKNTNS